MGGYVGGWHFWQAALCALEEAVGEARRFDPFRAHPPAAFRRLIVAVDDALRMAAAAVDVQLLLDDTDDGHGPDRQRDVAEMLLARTRELAAERTYAGG